MRGCAGRASATRGTYRSVLYQLAVPVHGAAGVPGDAVAGAKAPPPYSPGERAELAAIASGAARPGEAVLGAGDGGVRHRGGAAARGAGRAARRRCRRGHGGQVMVHVTGGPAPRAVPVAACYAGRALGLARRAGGGFVFRPGPADRAYKNFVNGFAARLAADPAAPRLSAGRCRASFICGHLAAGTPLPVLLAVTGIAEPESLARYARHVPGHELLERRPAGPLVRGAHAMSGGLGLPPGGGGISDETVAFAAGLIDRSGTAPVIEAALASRTGRPRPLPVRAVLTALLCLALDDRPLFFTEATRLLFQHMSQPYLRAAARASRAPSAATGPSGPPTGGSATASAPSARSWTPRPLPKNRRLSEEDLAKRTKKMTPAQIAGCPRPAGSVHQLPDRSQHVRPGPGRIRRAYDGSTGLDATPVPAVLPRPVQAHRAMRQRSRRRLVCPRRRPPRARGRQGKATAEDRLGAGSHHRYHRPACPAPPPACPDLADRAGADPARRRPRRHRRPRAGLGRRPRPQARLARLRPRLHPGPPRAVPPPGPGPGLQPGHGLPRRPARHPGKQPAERYSSREPGTAPPCPGR